MNPHIDTLYDYFISADKHGAILFIEDLARNSSYEDAFTQILEPALHKFGEKWASEDDVNLAQGYISAKITEEIMKRLMAEREGSGVIKEVMGVAVIGNIEDDYHSLGRKMVGNFLSSAGWTVYDMGNDVPAKEFVDKAVEVNASIIGASAMMYTNAVNMIKIRDELTARNLSGKIKFVAGGSIFNLRPGLVDEVKADGTAKNALEAVSLFKELLEK